MSDTGADTRSPVEGAGSRRSDPAKGAALCLSGGGYRAMLFHVGALWRLNEVGRLRTLERVSSVSGGSITAGVLGQNWARLDFGDDGVATAFEEQLVEPVRKLASTRLDVPAVLTGLVSPGSIGSKVADRYDRHLFEGRTLQDLPADGEGPRFVINATNVATGTLWRFSRPYMADWSIGLVRDPTVPLSVAVAASSAFPPVLSPVTLEVEEDAYESERSAPPNAHLRGKKITLSDGGVYDNLGLETAWKRYRTILVSDGGGVLPVKEKPARDWLRHTVRVLSVIDRQVRSLRKRQIIDGFEQGDRDGAFWGIHSSVADFGLADPLPVDPDRAKELAGTPTRLTKFKGSLQEELINWGYAVTDTALRRWVEPDAPRPEQLPYPKRRIDR
ncbi:MAG: patatin-like phospholipase family protein [Actinomycetota bacterium]